MIRAIYVTILCAIMLSVHQAQADDAKRTATILDSAGTVSEVTDLGFSAKLQKFDNSHGQLAFSTDTFDIAVPLDNVINIEAQEDSHTVTYMRRGKEVALTGNLFAGEFTGKSDFGDLKVHGSKLKSLKFNRPPKPVDGLPGAINLATLTLADGTALSVDVF